MSLRNGFLSLSSPGPGRRAGGQGGVSVCNPSHQTAVRPRLSWELQGVPADLWSDTQHGSLTRGALCYPDTLPSLKRQHTHSLIS
ncbi:hypothetical protein CesoFtcFv8_007264 [Champsocephalus esox]|uniref:Uncharacterized protein n=1 Tax=Champsocephalus esox TaxID=159716 RepID=A0AAN8CE82_9TELE|nr:hypothetical protein CesoFtcFv8_007264 [Champsocephalus esox]